MNLSSLELKVPPLLVVAIAAALMWLTAWALPAASLALPGRIPATILMALAGGVFAAAGIAEFRRARTTTNPLKPANASSLVHGGIYKLTRNPMYVGMALLLLGWGIYLSNPACLAVLFAFVAYMNRFQIVPEEKALESLFGAEFAAYRDKVRRWL
jgi:protein-S-isoprenylcysteine O-methyltransferase Ste14